MSRRLVFRRNAENELAEAVDWYEEQVAGQAPNFSLSLTQRWCAFWKIPFSIRSSTTTFVAHRFIAFNMASCMRSQTTSF
jgi:hypothetical protein